MRFITGNKKKIEFIRKLLFKNEKKENENFHNFSLVKIRSQK